MISGCYSTTAVCTRCRARVTLATRSPLWTHIACIPRLRQRLPLFVPAGTAAKISVKRAALQLLEETQAELVKRTQFFQKLVKKLNESIARQEEKERVLMETGVKTVAHHKSVELEQVLHARACRL